MYSVLKFGGTSVGSEQNMRMVASIIQDEKSKVTVLSAMSGTTDYLVKICNSAKASIDCTEEINFLVDKYTTCVNALITDNNELVLQKVNSVFEFIATEVKDFNASSEGLILAQGELLTTFIFTYHLKELGLKAELINVVDYMHTLENAQVDVARLKEGLNNYISQFPEDTFFVTQGFICKNYLDQFDNLGRGGSDYSAALIGAAININEVQIWTDIDGMHNNDPRYVEGTFPIRKMSYDEAAELAYFGAKILHPATILPCKEKGIDVRLKNTLDPKAPGTLITTTTDSDKTFHAVAAKDKITVIHITSARMLMAYGFLRKVFEVFEKYKTPIDMITTSEVAVSITIDNICSLDAIVSELEEYGKVVVEKDNSIICVVGQLGQERKGVISQVLTGIDDICLKMISYGASDRSVAILIDSKDKINALRELNKQLF
ncbi:MAG: aspartate kinase [Rikenellaceae bacterium]